MAGNKKPWNVKWDIKVGDTVVIYTERTGPVRKGVVEECRIAPGIVRVCGTAFSVDGWRDYYKSRHGWLVRHIRPWVPEDDEVINLNKVRSKADKNVEWLTSYIDRITLEQCEELNSLIERFMKEDLER